MEGAEAGQNDGLLFSWLFYASNEPKFVLARDLGSCLR